MKIQSLIFISLSVLYVFINIKINSLNQEINKDLERHGAEYPIFIEEVPPVIQDEWLCISDDHSLFRFKLRKSKNVEEIDHQTPIDFNKKLYRIYNYAYDLQNNVLSFHFFWRPVRSYVIAHTNRGQSFTITPIRNMPEEEIVELKKCAPSKGQI
jgi:hypothetical protein